MLYALTRPERVFVFQLFRGRLELTLREHEQEVPEVHKQHEHRLVPHDYVVDHDDGQRDDGHHVHGAVPDQRPLLQVDGLPGGQAGARRHAQRVVYGATDHRAHAQVRLGQERSDDADEQFRGTGGCRHERRTRHVRRDAQVCGEKKKRSLNRGVGTGNTGGGSEGEGVMGGNNPSFPC